MPDTEYVEFELQDADKQGGALYSAPHEIWNSIKIIFPEEYFMYNKEIPAKLWVDISLEPK